MMVRNIRVLQCFIFFLATVFFLAGSLALQESDLLPETQGAKALIEELIAKRYRQELSTLVDQNQFQLSVRLELIMNKAEPVIKAPAKDTTIKELPVITDLMLGTLDPEDLLNKYSPPDQAEITKQFLSNYRIKMVTFSIGLKEGLSKDTKTLVEKWLNDRVTNEFGKNGAGTVTIQQQIVAPPAIPTPEKQPIDLLNQFQNLAGQLALAIAILLGIILWRLLGGGSKNATPAAPAITMNPPAAGGASNNGEDANKNTKETELLIQQKNDREKQLAHEEMAQIAQKILEILPHLTPHFEAVIRSWCQMGETGRYKLAVFAETVGKQVGRLPIPIDALPEVGKVFTKITDLALPEKLSLLQKSYWDLLSVINLGPEILNQPFGYVGGLNTSIVNQMLMDKNPKLKTLVSIYMPTDMRVRYFKGLSNQHKLELLKMATEMHSIPASELSDLDRNFKTSAQPSSTKELVILDRALQKLIEALKPQEEIALVPSLSGPVIESYKRSVPSMAFLEQWPDDKLKLLLAKLTADEILPYLRLKPNNKKRFLELLPQFTADIISEELESKDKTSDDEKTQWLISLKNKMLQMFELKELALDDLFPPEQDKTNGLRKVS